MNFSISDLSFFNTHTRTHTHTCAGKRCRHRRHLACSLWSLKEELPGQPASHAFLLCLTDCIFQTAFAFLSLSEKSGGSLIRPFCSSSKPKAHKQFHGNVPWRGNSPITDLMSQFPSSPVKACAASVLPRPCSDDYREMEKEPCLAVQTHLLHRLEGWTS